METSVQRAILLKALMEALQKTTGVKQADFRNGKPDDLQGHFTRFDANPHTLSKGLPHYLEQVRGLLDAHPGTLPVDPIWEMVRDYVYGDAASVQRAAPIPPALSGFARWNQSHRRSHYLQELGGCWFIFRLSSKTDIEDPEIAVALLNLRTLGWYQDRHNPWTEFTLFVHQEGAGDPTGRIDGICMQYHTNMHFVGLLDREESPLPTALALHYEPGGSRSLKRREATEGLIFGANSHGRQVSAPIVALHISESDCWDTGEYTAKRAPFEARIKTHKYADVRDILPEDQFEALKRRTQESLVFQAD
jgi:hypothetical protein